MPAEKKVKGVGNLLAYINSEDLDYSICFKAIEVTPEAIQLVPLEFIDDEILEIVIRSGEECIEHIPKEALSEYAKALIAQLYPYTATSMLPVELNDVSKKVLADFYISSGIKNI